MFNLSNTKSEYGSDARRRQVVNDIANELGHVVSQHLDRCTKTCVNCANFVEKTEICTLAKQRPPARIIAFGCEKYEDEIPF